MSPGPCTNTAACGSQHARAAHRNGYTEIRALMSNAEMSPGLNVRHQGLDRRAKPRPHHRQIRRERDRMNEPLCHRGRRCSLPDASIRGRNFACAGSGRTRHLFWTLRNARSDEEADATTNPIL